MNCTCSHWQTASGTSRQQSRLFGRVHDVEQEAGVSDLLQRRAERAASDGRARGGRRLEAPRPSIDEQLFAHDEPAVVVMVVVVVVVVVVMVVVVVVMVVVLTCRSPSSSRSHSYSR